MHVNKQQSGTARRHGAAWFFAVFFCLAAGLFLYTPQGLGMGRAAPRHSVGVRSLAVITPDHARLGVMVWYPAQRKPSGYLASFGSWIMRAEKNAVPARLSSPVIFISHDMVDSNLFYHEIATALAGAGFIVVAPAHTGDNSENAGAAYSAAAFYYRPMQVHEALGALLREPDFAKLMDTQRIGLLGSGLGALTVLQLCGADLNYAAYDNYCEQVQGDEAMCSSLARSRLRRLRPDMTEIRSRRGARAFAAPMANVKAVAMLSPGWLRLAEKAEVAALRVPLAALFAGQGGLYPPVAGSAEVLDLFPQPLYDSLNYQIFEEADHYSLRSACPPDILAATPGVCGRISGSAREKLSAKRDAYFVSFFQAALGLPIPLAAE